MGCSLPGPVNHGFIGFADRVLALDYRIEVAHAAIVPGAAIESRLLTDNQIRRSSHHSVRELEAAIAAYIKTRNDDPKPFRWVKSADDILAAIQRSCQRTTTVQARCA